VTCHRLDRDEAILLGSTLYRGMVIYDADENATDTAA